jgi:hypothetical protein
MTRELAFRLGLLPSLLVARFAAARLRGRDAEVEATTVRDLMTVTLLAAPLPGPPPQRPRDHAGAVAWAREISARAQEACAADAGLTAAHLLGLALGDLLHTLELHALVHELGGAAAQDRALVDAEGAARSRLALAARNPALPEATRPVLFDAIAIVRTLDHAAPRRAVIEHLQALFDRLEAALRA